MAEFRSTRPARKVLIIRANRFATLLFVAINLTAAVIRAEEQPWISLFDGKTLDGWYVSAGSAEVDGGRLGMAGGTQLYCSKGCFRDFVLTADVLTESGAIGSLSVLWLNRKREPPLATFAFRFALVSIIPVNGRPSQKTGSLNRGLLPIQVDRERWRVVQAKDFHTKGPRSRLGQ